MSGTKDRLATPIPKLMRIRPRDSRGYPIPYIVLIDKAGNPQFTINNSETVDYCIRRRHCAICGRKMADGFWFVGGSRCFLHDHGAFIDPPVHYECGDYALRVCPFLAMPRYSGRIDDRKLKPKNTPDRMSLVITEGMPPAQPERFGFGHCHGFRLIETDHQGRLIRVDSWDFVSWWRNGGEVNAPDAVTMRELIAA